MSQSFQPPAPDMNVGTVLAFHDDGLRPHAEIALGNGDHIAIAIDHAGLTIRQIGKARHPAILFQVGPDMASRVCAGLVASPQTIATTPLVFVAAAVMQLASAADVSKAFQAAAERAF